VDNAICVTNPAVMFAMTAIMNQTFKETRNYISVTAVHLSGMAILRDKAINPVS